MANLNNVAFGGSLHTKRNPAAASGAVQPNMTTRQIRREQARLKKQKQQAPPANGFG